MTTPHADRLRALAERLMAAGHITAAAELSQEACHVGRMERALSEIAADAHEEAELAERHCKVMAFAVRPRPALVTL